MAENRYKIFSKGQKRAELLIYGDIGEDWTAEESNDARTVVKELQILNDTPLDVRVNSIGGSLADGVAILNALKRYAGPVDTYVDGLAYSAASLIVQGGDRRYMAENSLMMVHAPAVRQEGHAKLMRETADMLDIAAESMKSAYVRQGGPDNETVSEWLTTGQDYYFTAAQAKEVGLVDEITGKIDLVAALRILPKDTPAVAGKKEEILMDPKPENGGAPQQPSSDNFLQAHAKAVNAGQEQGRKSENARQRMVYAAFDGIIQTEDATDPMYALREQCLGDIAVDEMEVNRRVMNALKQRTGIVIPVGTSNQQPTNGGVYSGSVYQPVQAPQAGQDGVDKFVEGATKAIQIRSGLETDQQVIAEERKGEFLSMNLVDLAKASLRMAGLPVNGSTQDVVRRVLASGPGQGTDHFPAILENIANKAVMDGYMGAAENWQVWTQRGTLQDYRTASRVNKSLFETLDKMEEHEAFKHGRFADVKQAITGFLHGKSFSLTLQAIQNDDLSMLSEDARAWGESANRTIGDAVFVALTATGTGGFGQTMTEDSTVLFHANHSNYVASGSGAAPSAATISAGRTAMMTQTDPNGVTVASPPRYLLHPTTLTMTVFPLLNSQNLITGADTTVGERNAVQSLGIQSVEEYRMDSWVSTAWILAAARRTVEVAFVGGQSTPRVDRMPSGEIPGVTWQISIPFGVAALDYRTVYLNYGA